MTWTRIWKWSPDWSRGLRERLSYLTDVQASLSGVEYRTRAREHPRRVMDFQAIVTGSDFRDLDASLSSTMPDEWLMPLWRDVAKAEVSYVDPLTHFDADGIGLYREWSEGGYLVATHDGEWWAAEIVSVTDNRVSVSGEAPQAILDGARCYPASVVSLEDRQTRSAITAGVATVPVTCEVIDYRAPDAEELPETHDGIPILADEPNRRESIEQSYIRGISRVDYDVGRVERYVDTVAADFERAPVYTYNDRGDVWEMRRFIQHLGGRKGEMYAPTRMADLTIIDLTQTHIDIEPIGWSDYYDDGVNRDLLWVRLRGHDPEVAHIVSSEMVGDVERLTLGEPVDRFAEVGADSVRQAAWMERCRLATDEVTIDWVTAGVCELSLPQRAVQTPTTTEAVELFRFDFDDGPTYLYTSADDDIEYDGDTWEALPMARTSVSQDAVGEIDFSDTDVTIDVRAADVVREYDGAGPTGEVRVDIFTADRGDIDATIQQVFPGVVESLTRRDKEATFGLQHRLVEAHKKGPRGRYTTTCRHRLYGQSCLAQVDPEEWVEDELTQADEATLTVEIILTEDLGSDFFVGGYILIDDDTSVPGGDSDFEYRVLRNVVSQQSGAIGGGEYRYVLEIDRWHSSLSVGSTVRAGENPFVHHVTPDAVEPIHRELTVTLDDEVDEAHFVGGFLQSGRQGRRIVAQDGPDDVGGGDYEYTLTLQYWLDGLTTSSTVTISAGCDHTFDECAGRFANSANFGAIPTLDQAKRSPYGTGYQRL